MHVKAGLQFLNGLEVHGGVFAHGGMGTATGFDTNDALFGQSLGARENESVFSGVDVVGDDGEAVTVAHPFAKLLDERGFAASNGSADADAKRTVAGGCGTLPAAVMVICAHVHGF